MKIIFAGTSCGVPRKDSFCSATFIEINGNAYIIDAGAPISPLLLRYDLRHKDVRSIFISHFHDDHFDGLPAFCNQISGCFKGAEPEIYLPEECCLDMLHNWVQLTIRSDHDNLRLHHYLPGPIYKDDTIEVEALHTKHIRYSNGFRIKTEDKTLLFTCDMGHNYTELTEMLNGMHYDLVVTEGAHNSALTDCIDVFRQADTAHMVITHITPVNLPRVKAVQEALPFKTTQAYDGYTLEL